MRKLISHFQRNYDGDRLVRDELVPGAERVLAGKGTATRKWDGIARMIRDGKRCQRYDAKAGKTPPDGTCELIGPKIQGNPERVERHVLVPHGHERLPGVPRDFAGLKAHFAFHDVEGVVWWRRPADPDWDNVKLKPKDFSIWRGRRSRPEALELRIHTIC